MSTKKQLARQIKNTLATRPSRTFKMIRLTLWTLMFISVFGWVYVDWNLGNLFLAWLSIALGIGVAAFVSLLLERMVPEIAIRERKKKRDISISVLVISVSLLPPSLQYLNKTWSNAKSVCKACPVVSKARTYRRSYQYEFDVMIGPEQRQIDCDKDLWDKLVAGKDVEICIAKGGLGFDFITAIRP